MAFNLKIPKDVMELFSVASISRLTNAMSNFCRSNFYIFLIYFGFVEMMEFSTKKFGPIGRLSLVPATRHASRMFLER
jgi:hypothetical protein